MKQQRSTGVCQGDHQHKATQVMLHHHEWAETPSLLCHSCPAIMCIHGSGSLTKYMKWRLALEELQGCISSEKPTSI